MGGSLEGRRLGTPSMLWLHRVLHGDSAEGATAACTYPSLSRSRCCGALSGASRGCVPAVSLTIADAILGLIVGVGPLAIGAAVELMGVASMAVDVVKTAVDTISIGVEVGDTIERGTKVIARKL